MSSKHKPKVDPQLIEQLDVAGASAGIVQAVFQLNLSQDTLLKPEAVESAVRTVLGRVKNEVGEDVEDVNVFRHLGTFVVSAHAPFIRALIKEREIASATANIQKRQ
ncbi:MAG: hypothetical protein U0236_08785 [Nitrospira sp.]